MIYIFLLNFFVLFGAQAQQIDLFQPKPEELAIPEGPRKGQLVNARKSRPVKILTAEQVKELGLEQGSDDDGLWVANFRHHAKHYIAKIPRQPSLTIFQIVDRTPETSGVLSPTTPLQNLINMAQALPHFHAQLRFNYKEGIQLYSQLEGVSRAEPVGLATGLVISAEAAREKPRFDPFQAHMKHYLFAMVFVSAEEKLREALLGRPMYQYELNLKPEEGEKLIFRQAQRSESETYKSFYHLIKNNCSTETFGALDWLLGRQKKSNDIFWPHSREYLLKELRKRSLLAEDPYLGTVNAELGFPFKYEERNLMAKAATVVLDCAHFLSR